MMPTPPALPLPQVTAVQAGAIPPLTTLLTSPHLVVRLEVPEVLGELAAVVPQAGRQASSAAAQLEQAVAPLVAVARDVDAPARPAAVAALGKMAAASEGEAPSCTAYMIACVLCLAGCHSWHLDTQAISASCITHGAPKTPAWSQPCALAPPCCPAGVQAKLLAAGVPALVAGLLQWPGVPEGSDTPDDDAVLLLLRAVESTEKMGRWGWDWHTTAGAVLPSNVETYRMPHCTRAQPALLTVKTPCLALLPSAHRPQGRLLTAAAAPAPPPQGAIPAPGAACHGRRDLPAPRDPLLPGGPAAGAALRGGTAGDGA